MAREVPDRVAFPRNVERFGLLRARGIAFLQFREESKDGGRRLFSDNHDLEAAQSSTVSASPLWVSRN